MTARRYLRDLSCSKVGYGESSSPFLSLSLKAEAISVCKREYMSGDLERVKNMFVRREAVVSRPARRMLRSSERTVDIEDV